MNFIKDVEDLRKIVKRKCCNVLLVGGAEPILSESDKETIRNTRNLLVVYMNHAVTSKILEDLLPDCSLKVLVLRKKGSSTFHGLNESGAPIYNSTGAGNFLGIICIHSSINTNLNTKEKTFTIESNSTLYRAALEGYNNEFNGKKVSPTTGYFCEKIFSNMIAPEKNNKFYVIGMKLDNSVPRFPSHNIDFEQKDQELKFQRGHLHLLGGIKRSHVPIDKR